jgi:hypothetical protein
LIKKWGGAGDISTGEGVQIHALLNLPEGGSSTLNRRLKRPIKSRNFDCSLSGTGCSLGRANRNLYIS